MWPELLDMTREESKRILRRVELEAYSSLVSAFRAQGDLSKDKKRLLHDLQQVLSISTERHRAEVRRAVNDEKLATIADNMSPSNSTQEWLIEGRRLVPLMPRLVPQTAFTVTANQVANLQAEKNAALPSPSQTGIRDMSVGPVSSPPPTPRPTSRPSSPTSNVVVLPSGMSIHIKGGLNTEEEDDIQIRKRRRSTSTESLVSPTGTPVPQVTYTTTIASVPNISPKKITISKSPQAQPKVVASSSQTQKVILVSSQGQSTQGIVSQKPATMPIVRSTVSTGTSTSNPNKSIIFPSSSVTTNTSIGNIVTMASPSSVTVTTTTVSSAPLSSIGTSTTAFLTPTISVSRPRYKAIPKQKILQLPPPRPGVVIPMGPQPVQPSPQTIQALKPVPKHTPTIQIRQEGGMKIITQNIQGGASKILPKPSQMTTPSGTPVVVVSAGTSAPSSTMTMVNRAASSIAGTPTGTKVLNIQTQGGKIISAPRGSSVVTVNPKTLHLTAVKNAAGISGTKPNVIVVQKTQPRRGSIPAPGTSAVKTSTTAVISSPFEKELVSFLQKQDPTKQYVVTTTTANLSRAVDSQRKVIVTTSAHGDLAKQLSQSLQRSKTEPVQVSSNILQDLIQAAGIVPDGNQDNQSGEVTINLDESQLAALTSATQGTSQTKVTQSMPNNEWFEYDVTDEQGNTFTHTAESADTAAAIQSLLDMQSNGAAQKPKVTVQRSASVDIGQLSDQLNPQQFYTIEQAMTILNQPDKESGPTYIQADSHSQTQLQTGGVVQEEEILTAVPLKTSDMNIAIPQATQTMTSTAGSHGDLDPQTGMFYVDKAAGSGDVAGVPGVTVVTKGAGNVVGKHEVMVVRSVPGMSVSEVRTVPGVSVSEAGKNYDLLSSSLEQAQIDLDPFQFIEEGQAAGVKPGEAEGSVPAVEQTIVETVATVDTSVARNTHPVLLASPASRPELQDEPQQLTVAGEQVAVAGEQVVVHKMQQPVMSTGVMSDQVIVQKVVVSTPLTTTTPSMRLHPNTFVPIQEMAKASPLKASTITVASNKQMGAGVSMLPRPTATMAGVGTSIHVTVEPSGLDTSHMKIEDFSSQQFSDKVEYVGVDHMEEIGTADSPSTAGSSGLSDSQSEMFQSLEGQLLQQAKRKRKGISSGDESQSSPPTSATGVAGSWVRAALGVLNKVSRYRGMNRDKNDLNAATWFIQPVDPADAPDYYTIVENPMDFGTIKKKLEGGKYTEFDDFHADMMLVRGNCCLYNPEQSLVRRDCEEVFTFYQQEYEKLMDKWQKTHIASPISKKPRTDRSPIRP